jgi:hypothetical protein
LKKTSIAQVRRKREPTIVKITEKFIPDAPCTDLSFSGVGEGFFVGENAEVF